jgi:hypothetical protein
MRYLAISFLSLISPTTPPVEATLTADCPWLRAMLVLFVSAALLSLQLRRRQRNLAMPRALTE